MLFVYPLAHPGGIRARAEALTAKVKTSRPPLGVPSPLSAGAAAPAGLTAQSFAVASREPERSNAGSDGLHATAITCAQAPAASSHGKTVSTCFAVELHRAAGGLGAGRLCSGVRSTLSLCPVSTAAQVPSRIVQARTEESSDAVATCV